MTLDIETICEIVVQKVKRNSYRNTYDGEGRCFENIVAKDYPLWKGTGAEEYLSQKLLQTTPHENWEKFLNQTYNDIKHLLAWDLVGDPKYNQWTPVDGLDNQGYYHKWDYIHIVGKSEGKYGEQKHFHYGMEVSNCRYLKSRKAFNDLEIGKFYKIRMSKFTDNGRFSKYEYEYEEIDEYEYIWESLLTYSFSFPSALKSE